jgi:hypothetical protein
MWWTFAATLACFNQQPAYTRKKLLPIRASLSSQAPSSEIRQFNKRLQFKKLTEDHNPDLRPSDCFNISSALPNFGKS